jgi:glyoxalase family protein
MIGNNVMEEPNSASGITPGMTLRRAMHHITGTSSDLERTHAFYTGLLGLQLIKKTTDFGKSAAAHWYWGVGDDQSGAMISYFQQDPKVEPRFKLGAGQAHHFALAVPDEAALQVWREKLLAAGNGVTPVLDRRYFKSIYTTNPDGHIVELATAGPGFLVDETEGLLGEELQLPPWLEAKREGIVTALPRLQLP